MMPWGAYVCVPCLAQINFACLRQQQNQQMVTTPTTRSATSPSQQNINFTHGPPPLPPHLPTKICPPHPHIHLTIPHPQHINSHMPSPPTPALPSPGSLA